MNKIEEKGFKPIYKGIPPFMKFEKGFGYLGVLLEEESTGKLQCHLCGKTALNIAKHLYHKHDGVSPYDYRIQTGLSLTTPLVSESTRKKFKNNFLNLTESKKREVIARLRNLNKRLHSNPKRQRKNVASIQLNNRYGTCPEQIRHKFWEIYNRLGRIPNWSELGGSIKSVVEKRFESYEEALVTWGIPRQEWREHKIEIQNKAYEARKAKDFFPKYKAEEVRKQFEDFFKLKKRFPTWGEVEQFGMPKRSVFKRVFGCNKSELQNSLMIRN
jgi:hypothetical protein